MFMRLIDLFKKFLFQKCWNDNDISFHCLNFKSGYFYLLQFNVKWNWTENGTNENLKLVYCDFYADNLDKYNSWWFVNWQTWTKPHTTHQQVNRR